MIVGFFIIILLAIFLGKFTFNLTHDVMWAGFSACSLLSLYSISIILDNNYYVSFITSFIITTLIAALFILYKLDYKKIINNFYGPTNSYFDGLKFNITGNSSLFFWAMFLASALCILAILISRKIYSKMKLTGGKMGDAGPKGERGDSGNTSEFLNSKNEIAYLNVIQKINETIEEFKKMSVPPIDYIPDDEHLKNIFIKEEIRRICYSHEFNKMYIESVEKFRKLKGSDRKCDSENRALNHTIESIKRFILKWVKFILKYNKGQHFLESPFRIESDWDILYITEDKMKGLPPNPLESLNNKWNSLETPC